ncbi:MAG TPA: SpoIIE family protein phosphatase [Roseiflexaceae bacterium]
MRQPSLDGHGRPAALKQRSWLFRSLKMRLRWSYALVSVIPLALLGALLIVASFRTQRQNTYSIQQTAADWVAREVGAALSAIDEQLLNFGSRVGSDQSAADVRQAIGRLREATPAIVDVAVLDGEGRERAHVSKLRVFNDAELGDRGVDPLVRWVFDTARVAQGAITAQSDGTLSYPSYAPIFNDVGRVTGVVRAEIDATAIVRMLREAPLASGSYAYLVNSAGLIQLAGDPRRSSAPAALASLLTSAQTVHEYLGSAGEEVIGARATIATQPAPWWAVVEIPRALAYAPTQRDSLFLIAEIVLVIATTLAWGIYQARRIVRPIQELRAGAATIGAGDLRSSIPIHAEDEIGDLAQEFNRMAAHLQQSRAEIELQNDRLRQGLALARDIQLGLLPSGLPGGAQQFAVQARSIPAYEVGGDFYTYIALDDGRMAVAIGDISGKGVGAALMMALASSTVEAQGRAIDQPHKLLTALNHQLTARLKANRMNAALLYAVFDPSSGTMCVANAGMIAPVLVRDGRAQMIETAGLPLGSFAGARYTETGIELRPGDLIVLVSDGIVEARAPDGELFGFERLEQLLGGWQRLAYPEQLLNELIDHVAGFMAGAEQHDDMTAIVIQPNLGIVDGAREPVVAEEDVR